MDATPDKGDEEMKKEFLAINILLGLLLLWATACSSSSSTSAEADTGESGEHVDDEHDDEHADMAHMHVDPPKEFSDLTNSFAGDDSALALGKEVFEANCATCHGPKGLGDGPGAEGLDPKPATLADGTMMNDLSDGYLFWRVSKGGAMEPWNSAMPAWESGLTEDQRWQVISYVRSLADGSDDHEHMEDEHEDDHMEEDHVEDEHMEDEHEEGDQEEAEHNEGDEHEEAEHNEGDEHEEEEQSD
jgi:mono/diheme cytochrome c family protein